MRSLLVSTRLAPAPGAAALLTSLLWSTAALGHSFDTLAVGPFYNGILHLITDPSQLALATALGLLSGRQQLSKTRWSWLLATLAVAAGGWAAPTLVVLYPDHFTIALTTITVGLTTLLGLLLAASAALSRWLLILLALSVGASLGVSNGAEAAQGRLEALFYIGFITAGGWLLAVTAAVALHARQPWQAIAVRVVGSWIGALGLLMLGLLWSSR